MLWCGFYRTPCPNLVVGVLTMPPQENNFAVGHAPFPTEVCSPPRAHVPKYPSRPRTCARARPDFRVFAVLLPIRLTSDAFHRWQAEAKNPLTPLQRAREAKKAKKKKRGVGPWGGAVLAAVQKQAACRGAAMRVGELCALLPWLEGPETRRTRWATV